METMADASGSVLDKPEPKPGTFQKGEDGRRHRHSKAKSFIAPEDDGAPQQLQDMRHVYLNPGQFDKTQGQVTARQLLKKDPRGFMVQLAALEKDHRLSLKAVSVAAEIDEGSEAALALCEEWLRENDKG
jgi:hypothetical protein